MKSYLVDVPVKTNIWIRERCQREQFERIKEARPSVLFLQSDGGRTEEEWAIIRKNRKIFEEEIDWDCKVYKIYSDKNLGLYSMAQMTRKYIWERVDRCIFMEDDIVPSVSFFRFCAEMFERYADDKRIYAICGMNHIGVNKDCCDDYFFSRYGSIWGIGLWKRSIEQDDYKSFMKNKYYQKLLLGMTQGHQIQQKQIKSIINKGSYDNHVPFTEFFMDLSTYGFNQLLIIPKYNMIRQIGYGKDSAHSDDLRLLPKAIRNLSNMDTYDVAFPTIAPKYITPDIDYEKSRNRIMALDHPAIVFYRKITRGLLMIRYGEFKRLFMKIKAKRWEN